MQDFVGQHIDRYRITERLGMGGMAVVYKAYDTRLERDVAIKVIRSEAIPAEQHERMMKRFEREAKAQARFAHPHIISVHDYGEVDGAPYLVMAYIPGGTLKLRTGKPIPYQSAIRWLIPVADALSYAHKRGVVHRDIKPSNILFDDEDQPLLADFGIAKILETDEATLTGTGLGVGTPEYMAPEQWQGQATSATDQYALGVVLYELLTGQKPYTADTPVAVALLQMSEPLRSPCAIVPNIPRSVENLLYKALANNPQDRYEDMAAFQKALENLIDKKSIEALNPLPTPPASKPIPETISESETVDELEPTPTGIPSPFTKQQAKIRHEKENQKRTRIPDWARWVAGVVMLTIFLVVGINLLNRKPISAPIVNVQSTQAPVALVDTQVPIITNTPAATKTNTQPRSPMAAETSIPARTPMAEPTLGGGSTMVNPIDGAMMVYVPAGEFLMGSEDAYRDAKPEHMVYLDAFWIYQNEVTNNKYRQCVDDSGCKIPGATNDFNDTRYDDHPVVYVSWFDAAVYCEWAGGRLPTEAEWEKAARGTDGRKYPWGNDDPNCDLANYLGCVGYRQLPQDETLIYGLMAVGNYPKGASPYGALDMAGNAWEWVNDWYETEYYQQTVYLNPTGPVTGKARVLRGGAWGFHKNYLSTTIRYRAFPNSLDYGGFRCFRLP